MKIHSIYKKIAISSISNEQKCSKQLQWWHKPTDEPFQPYWQNRCLISAFSIDSTIYTRTGMCAIFWHITMLIAMHVNICTKTSQDNTEQTVVAHNFCNILETAVEFSSKNIETSLKKHRETLVNADLWKIVKVFIWCSNLFLVRINLNLQFKWDF